MRFRTIPLLLGLVLTFPAYAQTSGRDVLNGELQDVWNDLRPAVQNLVYQQARTQLAQLSYKQGIVEVSVRNLQPMRFGIQTAPGLSHLAYDRLALRVPRQGTWELKVEAEVRVKLNLYLFRPTIDVPVKLEVDRLSLAANAAIDQSDPTRPVIQRVDRPVVDFRLKVRSRQWLWNLLFTALSPIGNTLAHRLLDDALTKMMPQLTSLATGIGGPVPADNAAPLQDSGAATPFAEIIGNVERKIRSDHLPHGTIIVAQMDTPDTSSWETAYRNGGGGNAGSVVGYNSGGDSAIFTGMYLGGEAFRYHATGEPAALDTIRHVLGGISKLFEVGGNNGLLARVAAPLNSIVGRNIAARPARTRRQRQIGGQTWVCRYGSHGISRDQYSGIFFGLAITHDLIQDPAIRAECVRILRLMVDYLIAESWIVDEDRPSWDGQTRDGFPTFWAGVAYQKLTFLHIGERVAPGRYAATFAANAGLVDTQWMGFWLNSMNLESYYKFNLAHIGVYNYFRLETDPTRWQTMNRAYRIMERMVGHHRNAHFDLIQTTIDPSTRAALFPSVRESIRRFLGRNHREITPPVVDLSNVQWQTFTLPSFSIPGTASPSGPSTVRLPTEPLDFHQRAYTGHFHWQRTPFKPAAPNAGNPRAEKHGLDLTLPYWMGRHLGAF